MRMDRKQRHIDDIFAESLKGFEMMPPDAVWTSIETELDKKRRYPLIVFWSSLAAGIALLIGLGIFLSDISRQAQVKSVSQIKQQSSNRKEVLASKTKSMPSKLKFIKLEKNVEIATVTETKGNDKRRIDKDGSLVVSEMSSSAELVKSQEVNTNAVNSVKNKMVVDSAKRLKENRWNIFGQVAKSYSFSGSNRGLETSFGKNDFKNNEKRPGSYLKEQSIKREKALVMNQEALKEANLPVEIKPFLSFKIAKSQLDISKGDNVDKIKPVIDSTKNLSPESQVTTTQPLGIPELNNIEKSEPPVKPAIPKENRWSLICQVAPLYSFRVINGVSGTNPGKGEFNSNEKGLVAYSSGIKVDYKASRRVSVQTGIYYAVMGQEVDNSSSNTMMAFSYNLSDSYRTSQINTSSSFGAIATNEQVSKKVIYSTAQALTVTSSSNTNAGSSQLVQQLKYVEIPLLARYKIIDKRIGVHVLGGVGANFLVNNDVFLEQGGSTTNIGKTQNLRNVNYSGTFGIGFNCQLIKQLGVSIEPTCKYYITPLSNNSELNVHPYSLGLFTGLIYKF
ncbi:MAG: hypothetical protein Q8928_15605 [Bacteroidota bacterium]|nr:hypothetical protein [Bacteroidota bacterium]